MKPGQLMPNKLETGILKHIAKDCNALGSEILKLHVLSREYTGVGSYTNFLEINSIQGLGDRTLGLKGLINVPELKNGLGAVLFFKAGRPMVLEIFTYGEHWYGIFEGFVISDC